MISESEKMEGCDDDDPIPDSCHIDIRRLTEEEIRSWTRPKSKSSSVEIAALSSGDLPVDPEQSTREDSTLNERLNNSGIHKQNGLSLYVDDEIITLNLDRDTKKKIRIYDKCSIPEKLVRQYNALKKKKDSTFSLFCLFCLKEYKDVYQAYMCHHRETKHFPYRCVQCEEVTLDVKDMVQHYAKSHPEIDTCQFRRTYAPAKERWVKRFIIYQLKCITSKEPMLPNSILHKYCPVCNQWDYKLSEKYAQNKLNHKHLAILDRNHINKHLKYHPFQCKICTKQGSRFDLSMVNNKAREHLITAHGFIEPTQADCENNFDTSALIPELERYINSYIKYIQESFTDQDLDNPVSPITTKTKSSNKSSAHQQSSTPLPATPPAKKAGTKASSNNSATGKTKRLADYSIDDYYYPSPKYSRRDSDRYPKNGKRSSSSAKSPNNHNDSSQVEFSSYLEETANHYSQPENNSKILCIFCNDTQNDVLAAWDHYATHLDYNPISCQICQKTFPGPKAFQLHGVEHVDRDNLPYKWSHDEIVESWISDFVHSITTNDIIAKPEFACCCPVCCKKFLSQQQQKMQSVNQPTKLCYEDIREHIYSHLRYQPFHCNLCCNERVYVSDIANDGLKHLTFHEIVRPSIEISNYFTHSRGIPALDTFISSHFAKIRRLFNMPDGINRDDPLSIDPVCDVAKLFDSLQETLGQNTLNNILDNVTTREE